MHDLLGIFLIVRWGRVSGKYSTKSNKEGFANGTSAIRHTNRSDTQNFPTEDINLKNPENSKEYDNLK